MYYMPGILFFALFDTTRMFLVAIDEPLVPTIVACFAVPSSYFLGNLFTVSFGLGTKGLAISLDIIYFAMFMALTLYCAFTKNEKIRKAWSLPGKDSFKDWKPIL